RVRLSCISVIFACMSCAAFIILAMSPNWPSPFSIPHPFAVARAELMTPVPPGKSVSVPAAQRRLVVILGRHPVLAAGAPFLLPERRPRLQVVHQELGRLERRLTMARGGGDHHDRLARAH